MTFREQEQKLLEIEKILTKLVNTDGDEFTKNCRYLIEKTEEWKLISVYQITVKVGDTSC